MKYLFYAFVLVPYIWGLSINGGFDSIYSHLAISYTSAFWGTALIYLYDFSMAILGHNSKYMTEFYSENKNEVFVNVLSAVILAFIFLWTPVPYSLSNIDIAAAGLPFFFNALIDTWKCANIKVAGFKLPKLAITVLSSVQISTCCAVIICMTFVSSGKASGAQSIWIQITIICAAMTFFFGAKQMRFILSKQKMEVSPVLLDLLKSIPFCQGMHNEIATMASVWNNQVKIESAAIRKEKKKRIKRKK